MVGGSGLFGVVVVVVVVVVVKLYGRISTRFSSSKSDSARNSGSK